MTRLDPAVARRTLERKLAERQAADEAAMRDLRARLPEAVRLLVERFAARRIWLFGSLATGLFHHAHSDVDLAVEGLSIAALGEARREVERLLGREVDLVGIEDARERLRRDLDERGEVLFGA